jgi:hypothetical protein
MGDIMTCKINADTSDGLKIVSDTSGIVEIQANGTKSNNISFTGRIVQTVNTQTTAVATGTTIFPADDTIPQKTDGDEYMTLAITPTNASNKLRIFSTFYCSHSEASSVMSAGLFQDDTAATLNAVMGGRSVGGGRPATMVLDHYMTAGTTSATTFKIRAGGPASGTTTFNGLGTNRFFGGLGTASITIQEIEV